MYHSALRCFPADSRVKEQIASILAEEGATAEALVRYEELAVATKDRFRKVELSVWAAQLKETLGRRDEALADFEKLLGQVNPDSWMYQDLRSRIDRVFTSRNEYDALAKYYKRWVGGFALKLDKLL
jgi:tetratricopeptide (TPR) repeat protein